MNNGVISPFVDDFVNWILQISSPLSLPTGQIHEKIYVSKGKWRADRVDYRALTNEAEIRESLERNKFMTVFPEELSWLEQVILFSKAKLVVGEFSSALHNALLTGSRATWELYT
jgi:capsular polysaccharide biosynthesis protein